MGDQASANQFILAVTSSADLLTPGTPGVIARGETELERIASELGRIFYADVHRLSNGVIIIKTAVR